MINHPPRLSFIIAAFALGGCSNDPNDLGAYSLKHYGDLTGFHPYRTPNSLISANYRPVVGATGSTLKEDPQFIGANSKAEAQAIHDQYIHGGYHLLGTSKFSRLNIPMDLNGVSKQDYLDEAKFIQADIALSYAVPNGGEIANVVVSSEVSPAVASTTQVIGPNDEELGTLQTQSVPQIKWNYANRYVEKFDNYVEFLAK